MLYGSKRNNKLVTIEKINIYQNEIDYINSLDIKYDYKKILFAFLVQKKLNKVMCETRNHKEYKSIYFKGGKRKYQHIKSMANVSNNIKINDDFINDVSQGESPIIKSLNAGLISLEFLNNCHQNGNVAIEVKNYEDVGWYFDYYNCVDKIVLCKQCGRPFKQKHGNEEYCDDCKGYQEIKKKVVYCIDCGKEVIVDAKDNQTTRCEECYKKWRTEYYRINKQKHRKTQNVHSTN